jgi:hypothetical protein
MWEIRFTLQTSEANHRFAERYQTTGYEEPQQSVRPPKLIIVNGQGAIISQGGHDATVGHHPN